MNNEEAIQLLEQELSVFRQRSYADLVDNMRESPFVHERSVGDRTYQVEVEVLWEYRSGGNILVIGSIDDGGWRSFAPLTRSFFKSPDEPSVRG